MRVALHAMRRRWWEIVCRRAGSDLRFSVMDTINDNNTESAERFIAHVREKLQPYIAKMPLRAVEELLVAMVSHVTLRDMRVANGNEVDPELNGLADAAVYFFEEVGFKLNVSFGHEE